MYPSKILLFGEYTILLNSHALAIPYGRFKGEWASINDIMDFDALAARDSNRGLKEFLEYLKLLDSKQSLEYFLDIKRIEEDLENGIYFKSDIPMGLGLGSSGALVAAIFNRYSKNHLHNSDVLTLKNSFAILESFYHGTSSGIDPLVSYLNSLILKTSNKEFEKIDFSIEKTLKKNGFFLVNSGQNRKASDLIKYFNKRCMSDNEYLKELQNHYIPLNNECIKELTSNNESKHFFSIIHKLSSLQLILFERMIPKYFIPFITYGLSSNLFSLKLCGSGGGGYFLGFSENVLETKEFFKKEGYEILFYS